MDAQGEGLEDATLLALQLEAGATSRGQQVPLGAGKGKEMESSPEPPGGAEPCQHTSGF